MPKSIQGPLIVIGGGLYGCLTACRLKMRFADRHVVLYEGAKELLSSFSSVNCGGHDINNGFHGLELPRCAELFEFLQSEVNVDMQIIENQRLLYFGDGIIQKYEDSIKDYNEALKKHFLAEDVIKVSDLEDFNHALSDEIIFHFESISKRYSDKFDNAKSMIMPWFLPSNYKLISDDEGDIYRNQVRDGAIKAQYGLPKSHLFKDLMPLLLEFLLAKGVEVVLNSSATFTRNNILIRHENGSKTKLQNENCEIFYCMSDVPLIKERNKELFHALVQDKRWLANILVEISMENEPRKFSEMLFADQQHPHISRASKLKTSGDKQILQVEAFINTEDQLTMTCDAIPSLMSDVFNVNAFETSVIGAKITRPVFFPSQKTLSAVEKFANDYFTSLANVHFRNIAGPINMAKCWQWASENIELVNT